MVNHIVSLIAFFILLKCSNSNNDVSHRVVVNTGDRFAARKALMQTFRGHLELFRTGGKHCSKCCDKVEAEHNDAVEIDGMMKSKFSMTWRQSMLAWITFMGLLLLAFIYADNTDWGDSWYRTPTKYNITDLLNADDDAIADLQPKPKGKAAKNSMIPDIAEVDEIQKKGKTAKNNANDAQDDEVDHADKAGKKM